LRLIPLHRYTPRFDIIMAFYQGFCALMNIHRDTTLVFLHLNCACVLAQVNCYPPQDMSTAEHRFRPVIFDVFLFQPLICRPLSVNSVKQLTSQFASRYHNGTSDRKGRSRSSSLYYTSDRRPEASEGIFWQNSISGGAMSLIRYLISKCASTVSLPPRISPQQKSP
jgi:hypothetical protein